MRKLLIVGAFTFALGFATAVYLGRPAAAAPSAENPVFPLLRLFGDALGTVEKDYVAPVDDRHLIEGAIAGMMRSLDDHSDYLDPQTFSLLTRPAAGKPIGSVGLELVQDAHDIRIAGVLDETPGARATLRAGDHIIAIDGVDAVGLPLDDAIAKLRGEVGEPVTLRIARSGSPDIDIQMIREAVKEAGAKAHMEGDFGYLRPPQFYGEAAASTAKSLRDLEARNPRMKGLVLDLRSNPGGLVSEAVGIANIFLDGGEIVSARGRDPKDVEHYNARPHADMLGGRPIVVLINSGTASGAEIVAGALQDRGRAAVVGMTSFGSGTVQTVIPLNRGMDGALKMTTARLYTPNGRSIQGVGIQPDLKVAATRTEAEMPARLSEAGLPRTLSPEYGKAPVVNAAAAEAPTSADFKGDFQLKRALDVLTYGSVAATPREAVASKGR